MLRAVMMAGALCAAWAVHDGGVAQAQSRYPNRPIKVVVPFPPGGPTDGMARLISERLGAVLGQSIVVDNHGGGGGSIGARLVATADPDGYTLLLTPGGSLTSGPAVHRNIGYDPAEVFAPVALLTDTPNIISLHPDVPAKSLPELVTYARAHPGKISWGSQGFGTSTHLLAEMFKLEAGLDIVHVPYRGTAPLLAAIVGGEVHMIADPSTTSLPLIQSGRLRPIAIAGPERFAQLPEVPTTPEVGFASLQSSFWLGVVAPAGTPPAIIDQLNAAFRASLADPPTRARLESLGAEIKIGTPAAFAAMLARERTLWTGIVKAANLQVD